MYLSELERKEAMVAYGLEKAVEKNHYQVEEDIWVYFFEEGNKKYILISTDYLGYFEFDVFPHLLKLENNDFNRLGIVLQREISIKDENFLTNIRANIILFEYTN